MVGRSANVYGSAWTVGDRVSTRSSRRTLLRRTRPTRS